MKLLVAVPASDCIILIDFFSTLDTIVLEARIT